jgi:hypothetical protein
MAAEAKESQLNAIVPGLNPNLFMQEDDVPNLSGFPNWQLGTGESHPISSKADQLVTFCLHSGAEENVPEDPFAEGMLKRCLSVQNVGHFVKLFANFQGHWPVIHMPTFDFDHAYDGLLLTMVCIGTVYSDRLSAVQVTWLMLRAKRAVYRTTRQVRGVGAAEDPNDELLGPAAKPSAMMEQMQALTLLQILLTWHGDEAHRDEARKDFPGICKMLRRHGFLEPIKLGQLGFSPLHHPGSPLVDMVSAAAFDWEAWVEQEKRLRIIYNIYLLDTAMVVYFNTAPEFDSQDLVIPMPADEVVWDAQSAHLCANALGLDGERFQVANATGSRQKVQPLMAGCVRALLELDTAIPTCNTNVYSKFILIHALHVQIWMAQHQLAQHSGNTSNPHSLASSQGTINGSLVRDSGIQMAGPSGVQQSNGVTAATNNAVEEHPYQPAYALRDINPANAMQQLGLLNEVLTKWKRTWDEDVAIQYPQSNPPADASVAVAAQTLTMQRFGFGRDAVPFYWLARAFLKNTTSLDAHLLPDQRLVTVLKLLKRVKQWVAMDNIRRGEPTGSVNDIDDGYGIDQLTLDMKLFFAPIKDRRPTDLRVDTQSIVPATVLRSLA